MSSKWSRWSLVVTLGAVSVVSLVLAWHLQRELKRLKKNGVKHGIEELIGDTPVVEIRSLSKITGCKIYAKLEMNNPAGSAKDRVALAIIRKYESLGIIKPGHGDVIFEGTSGSTGISFAMLCNALGYTAHICLPDDTSLEKLLLLESLGAQITKVKPLSIVDPSQYVNLAKKLAYDLTNDNTDRIGIFLDQFENDANWKIHYNTTSREIWDQMEHDLQYFIAGSGTGGTIAGCSRYLKEQDSRIKVILADPQGSGLYNRVKYGVMYDKVEKEGTRRRHQVDTIIEGIGLTRVTYNFSRLEPYIDDAIRVSDDQLIKMLKFLSINDGLFWGSSSCINAVALVKIAQKAKPGSKILIIGCDNGSRHLSKFWKLANAIDRDITIKDVMLE